MAEVVAGALAEPFRGQAGSTCHYFPGGKRQLVTEAVRFAGCVAARSEAVVAEAVTRG